MLNTYTWKLYNTEENVEKIQINGNTYHVHGLEELTYLKCPYYQKQSIDSMKFLVKYQWYISQI